MLSFFSTDRRLSRLPYAAFMISVSVLLYAMSAAAQPLFADMPITVYSSVLIVIGLIELVCIWPFYALSVRRLKDINAPTWPAAVFLLPLLTTALFLFAPFIAPPFIEGSDTLNPAYETFNRAAKYVSFGVVWIDRLAILILSLIPGTKGPNRYAPPPGQKTAADISVFE